MSKQNHFLPQEPAAKNCGRLMRQIQAKKANLFYCQIKAIEIT